MMMKRLKVKQMVALLLCACCIIALIPALPAQAVKCANLDFGGGVKTTAVADINDIPQDYKGLVFEYTEIDLFGLGSGTEDLPEMDADGLLVEYGPDGTLDTVAVKVYSYNTPVATFSAQVAYDASVLQPCDYSGDYFIGESVDDVDVSQFGSALQYPALSELGVLSATGASSTNTYPVMNDALGEALDTPYDQPLSDWGSEATRNAVFSGGLELGIWKDLTGASAYESGKLNLDLGMASGVTGETATQKGDYDGVVTESDGSEHVVSSNALQKMHLFTLYLRPVRGKTLADVKFADGSTPPVSLFADEANPNKDAGCYVLPWAGGSGTARPEDYIKNSYFVAFPGITYNDDLPTEPDQPDPDPEKKMTVVSTLIGSNEYVEIGLNINGRSAKAEDFQNAGALLSYDNTKLTPVDWNGNTLDLPTVDSMAAAWAGGKLLPTKNADQMNSQLAAVFSTGGKSYLYLSAGAAKPLTGYQQSLPTGEALTSLPATTENGKTIAGIEGGGTLGAGQAVVARFKVNGSYTAADLAAAVDLASASTGLTGFPVDLAGNGAAYDDGKGSGAAALADVDFFWIANGASASTGGSSGGETGERTYSLLFSLLGGQVYLRPDGATSGGTDVTTSLFQAINGKSANTAVNLPTYTGDMTGQKLVFVNSGKEYESLTFVGTDGKQYTFNSNNTWTGANGNSVTIPDHDMSLLALWPNGSISGGGSGETGDRTYSLLFNLLGGEVYVRDGGTDQPVGSTLFADRTGIAGNTNAALPTQAGLTAGQTLVFKNGGQEYTELTFAGTDGNKYTLKSDNTWTDASGNPVSTVAMAEHDMALLALWPNGSISGSTGHRLMFNLMSGSVLVRDAGATVGGSDVTDTLFVEQTITNVGAAVTLPTQADLNGGSLVFVHGGKEYDSLTFIGTDGNTYILKSDNTWANGDGTAITSLTMPGNDVCLLALWPNGGIGGAAASHRLMFNLLSGDVLVRDASATEGGTSVGGALFAEIAGLNTGDLANLPTQADMTDKTLVFKNGDQEYESLTFVGTDGKKYTLNKDNTWTGANGSSLTMPDHDMALLALWPNGTIGGGSSGGGEGSATHKLMFNLLGADGDVVVRPSGATDNTGDVSVKADLFAGLSDLNTGDAATLPLCPDGKLNGGNLVFTKGGKEYKSLTFIGTNGEQYTLKTDNTWAGADGAPVATVTMPDNDVCLLALWPNGAVSGSSYRLLLSMMNGKAVARTNTTPDAAPGEEVWTERDVTAELEQLFADLDGVKEGEDITLPTVTLNEGEQLAFRDGDEVYNNMSFLGTDKEVYIYNGTTNSWNVEKITMSASHVALAAQWPASTASFSAIVMYDWDDTLLGSIIVAKNADATAAVKAFAKGLTATDDEKAALADEDKTEFWANLPNKPFTYKKGYSFEDVWLNYNSETLTHYGSAVNGATVEKPTTAEQGVADLTNITGDMTLKACYGANGELNATAMYTTTISEIRREGSNFIARIEVSRNGAERLGSPAARLVAASGGSLLPIQVTLTKADIQNVEVALAPEVEDFQIVAVDAYGVSWTGAGVRSNNPQRYRGSIVNNLLDSSEKWTGGGIVLTPEDGYLHQATVALINEALANGTADTAIPATVMDSIGLKYSKITVPGNRRPTGAARAKQAIVNMQTLFTKVNGSETVNYTPLTYEELQYAIVNSGEQMPS